MSRASVFLTVATAAVALAAGCGSASPGSACSDLGRDLRGIYGYVKLGREQAHPNPPNLGREYLGLTPSQRRAEEKLQRQANEAHAACIREGRVRAAP